MPTPLSLRSLLLLLILVSALRPAAAQPPQPAQPPVPQSGDEHPFAKKFPLGEFPPDIQWMNTRPLKLRSLRGKFVLLDFWTYCCINCIHVLPELKKLEHQYADQLVVIGVHSAKFETEKDTDNISEAILRYEIEHPVINDANHTVWNSLGVRSWPTVVLIDPEGNAVWGRPGEIKAKDVAEVLDRALPYYRKKKLLDETPVRFELLAYKQPETPLKFPGKVLADEQGERLFITDSNHNRIVVTDFEGAQQQVIGSGKIGRADGDYQSASFHHPQGLALHGDTLYVADTENHLLRKVDLESQQVSTIAGLGEQARFPWPGIDKLNDLPDRWVGPPLEVGLNSPWALWVHQQTLYIAMAGPHQIWSMPLDEREIGPYAGSSREDIIDGKLLPKVPPQLERFFPGESTGSAFAQPSGLTSDGQWLYVADSEGSSIRAVPFDPTREVKTVIGTADLPQARLFTFGDVDGERESARLQHALGVSHHGGKIYVADTYNNKVKVVDAKTGFTKTLAGSGKSGKQDGPADQATFDEPAGLCYAAGKLFVADTNNHAIRVVDVSTGAVSTLALSGVTPPAASKQSKPDFSDAQMVELPPATVQVVDGKVQVAVEIQLPKGWKLNPLAPWSLWLESQGGEQGPWQPDALGKRTFTVDEKVELDFEIPVRSGAKSDLLTISLPYYYCSEGGLCKVGSVVWKAPVKLDATAEQTKLVLPLKVLGF